MSCIVPGSALSEISAYAACLEQITGWTISVADGPDVAFFGHVISSYKTVKDGGRWSELLLYATKGGGFVAARGWHSTRKGESPVWHAAPVETVRQTMDLWGWDIAAKIFARELNWDVLRRIP